LAGLAGRPGFLATPRLRFDPAERLRRLETGNARLGVCFLDTDSLEQSGNRLDEHFAMCSTFKLAMVGACLREADAGRLNLAEILSYTKSDLLAWSPVTSENLEKGGMSIAMLAQAAQQISDGTAANLLVKRLGGPAAVTAKFREMGDPVSRLDRYEPMLAAQIRQLGGEAVRLGIAKDERGHLGKLIAAGLECDFLFLSGGVSAGKLDLVPSELAAQGVRTTIDVSPQLIIQADREALRRAILNLVLNSLDAMPEGGGLTVTAVVVEGAVELEIPVAEAFTFRPGQLQATPVFAIADFAAVSAAGTLLPPGWLNATIDATLKLVGPAKGRSLRARGRVVDAGKLLTVCAAEVYAVSEDGRESLCATLLGTARNMDASRTG